MLRFSWLSTLFRKASEEPPQPNAAVRQALSVLKETEIINAEFPNVRRFAVSKDSRYCALTMSDYESYAVDIETRRYLHYPTAGVTGFVGISLVLSPDEERFLLEPSGAEPFEVNLQSESLPWVGPKCSGAVAKSTPNPSIERDVQGLAPSAAPHVKR